MGILSKARAHWAMGLMLNDKKDGDLDLLRMRLDRFLEEHADSYPFMLAFDAILRFAEERDQQAHARLSECLGKLLDTETPEARYVRLYCEFYQALYSGQEWREILAQMSEIEIDPWIKSFLKLPIAASVEQIIEEETHRVRGRRSI